MNRPAAPTTRAQDEPADIDEEDQDANDGSDEDDYSSVRLIHDGLYVPSYPSKLTGSGLIRSGGGGGNGAMLILDEAAHPPIAFSASLPSGIQLSHLPDPRSVRGNPTPMDGRMPWTRRWRTSSRTTYMN